MTGRLQRPGAVLLVVLAVLAVGLGAASYRLPTTAPVTATADEPRPEVPLARAAAACPAPVAGVDSTTRVAVGAPGPQPGIDGGRPGRFTLETLDGKPVGTLRGVAPAGAVADAAQGEDPVAVRAVGRSAPGLAASQLTRSTNAAMRGLAGVTCTRSGTDVWFVGSGSIVGQRGRVYLTNTEAAPAVVDVTLYGPEGQIEAPDARGVTVAPGGQEVRLLDALAPGVERFAVHVRARLGRVSAAVRDLQVDGLTPLGADWVPPTTAPARRMVVAGVPGGAGERHLQIVAPGSSDAIVRVRLISESGAFAPSGLDVIEVRAGTVSDVDLAPFTAGDPVSVELDSDAPVTAGVLARVTGADGALGELAYAAGAVALTATGPGVVPEVRASEAVTSTLLLTAPGPEVTVTLTPLPPAAGPGRRLTVAAGSQLPVDLASVGTAATFALLVTPVNGSGPLLAVRQVDEVEARGPFITSSPVLPGRYSVAVPRVVADLSTGLRLGTLGSQGNG